jgi:transcriptional regulator GlxA family with amidase domain
VVSTDVRSFTSFTEASAALPGPPAPPLRRIAALVHERASPFELGVLSEVFGWDRTPEGLPGFEFSVCTRTAGELRRSDGFDIVVPNGLEPVATADLVVVVPSAIDTRPYPEAVDALHAAVERGGRVASMCTAAFILARAGLLDGRRATTHWFHAEAFRREFPGIELVPDVLYVEDGPIATSAGTASGIDLCLHLVRRSHGAAAAAGIARRMVVPPHRDGGQAQYVTTPVRIRPADTLTEVLDWAGAHLDEDLSVARLAEQAAMSERTFARRFRDETGTTPKHWVLTQRLALAEQLLESGATSVDEVARRCGFSSAAMLRHHFARLRSTTPTAYRSAFAGSRRSRSEPNASSARSARTARGVR